MKPIPANWIRKVFKKNKVWMALDHKGNPLTDKNKVLIKYQLEQEYEYWVNPDHIRDITSIDSSKQTSRTQTPSSKNKPPGKIRHCNPVQKPPEDAIVIYTDGASSGNPGPSGIGIVMEFGSHQREISKYIGNSTNNIAELTAVKIALVELKKKDIPVRIYTDSNYVYGLLMEGWKPRKNIELINSIKQLLSQFLDIKIIKVKGHVGIGGNERADRLATEAINKTQ